MKKRNIIFSIGISLLGFMACKKDFVAVDLSDKTITVNSPANNLVTTSNKVTFWWEELDGADKYNIQVVKPNFSTIASIIADTSISGTKLHLTIEPGTYQWRIRAMSNAGNSVWQTFSLKVDTTSNLTGLTVSVIEPSANFLTGNKRVSFSWNPLNSAVNYQIILLNSTNGVVKDTTTALTTYTYNFSAQGIYSWKVRALNDFSISQFITPLPFTIDLTPPIAPVLTLPSNGAMITTSTNLSWSRVGSPDARYDSVFVATDSLFTNVVSKTKTYLQSIPVASLTNAPPATGTFYWWKLRSVDSVGNRSVYSSQLKFKLNP